MFKIIQKHFCVSNHENGVLHFNWDKSNDLDFYAYVITVNNSPFNLIDTIFSINYGNKK